MNEATTSTYLESKYYTKSHRYWMWGHVIVFRKKVTVIAILTILAIAVQTAIPLLFGRAIDDAIPNKDTDQLILFAVCALMTELSRCYRR